MLKTKQQQEQQRDNKGILEFAWIGCPEFTGSAQVTPIVVVRWLMLMTLVSAAQLHLVSPAECDLMRRYSQTTLSGDTTAAKEPSMRDISSSASPRRIGTFQPLKPALIQMYYFF